MDDLSVALNNSGIGGYLGDAFLIFFFEKNYLLLSYATSVRPTVRPSVRLSSVEIISFRGISISNRPIDPKLAWMSVRG